MGAIVLDNDYSGVNKNLASLASSVARAVNPLHDYQIALQNHLASNPDLMQHFSDIEHTSPGTLEAMGMGDRMIKAIKTMPPSMASQIEQQTNAYVAAHKKRQADVASGIQHPEDETTPEGPLNLQQMQEHISKLGTGMSTGAAAQDVTQGLKAGEANKLLDPKSPDYDANVAREAGYGDALGTSRVAFNQRMSLEKAEDAASKINMSGRDIGQDVKTFNDNIDNPQNKGLDSGVLQAYNSNPLMAQSWHEALAADMANRRQTEYMARLKQTYGQGYAKADDASANRLVMESHGAFDKPTAMQYLTGDDSTVRRIGELAAGTGQPMQPGEEGLYRAAQYEKMGQATNFESARHQVTTEVNSSFQQFKKAPNSEEGDIAADQLNNSLRHAAALTGEEPIQVKISYPKGTLWGTNREVTYTKGGKTLSEPEAIQQMHSFAGGDRFNPVDQSQINEMDMKFKGQPMANIQATLMTIKASNPELYQAYIQNHPEYNPVNK